MTIKHLHSTTTRLAIALALATFAAPGIAAAACDRSALFAKSHTWTDADADGMTTVGDVLHYTVTFCEPGAGNRRCELSDTLPPELTLDPTTVVCTPEAGTTPPSNCAEATPGVIEVDYRGSRMDRNACVTLSFDAVVSTAPAAPICNQAVNEVDRSDVSDDDCHPLVPLPDLEIEKVAAAASVQPGDAVAFDITVHNVGTGTLTDGLVSDFFEACFLPLGPDGDPCDPALVSCSGIGCAAAACVYSTGGLGFNVTGLELEAENRLPGGRDEIVITVALTAGDVEATCRNDAETADPDSPSLTAGDSVEIARRPDLEIEKLALSPAVEPGGDVAFDITVRNTGTASLAGGIVDDALEPCFDPLGPASSVCDPAVVVCSGPGCSAAVCTYSATGFTYTGLTLAADDGAGGGDDELVITVNTTAGLTEGACVNSAETSDPDSPSLVATATVDIAALPLLALTKDALSPRVAPGATVDFEIVASNLASTPVLAELVDIPEPCFEPLGIAGDPCDPAVVSCVGAACGAASCVYEPGGLGFSLTGLALAADDAAPGGDDEAIIRVTATAGLAEGACTNDVDSVVPGPPAASASDTVEIRSAVALCDLMFGFVTFPPRAPPLDTLYVRACGAGDPRLDVIHTPLVTEDDLTDDFAGPPGLVLYELDCGCSERIALTKNVVSGKVRLGVF